MKLLTVIFIPPLYFLSRKLWGAFVINSFFYGIACLFVLSLAGIMFAPIPWIISVIHAMYYFKREKLEEHATLLATKMAQEMGKIQK